MLEIIGNIFLLGVCAFFGMGGAYFAGVHFENTREHIKDSSKTAYYSGKILYCIFFGVLAFIGSIVVIALFFTLHPDSE